MTTDETGHYTFSLPPGSYVLHYVGNSHWAPQYYDNRLYFETANAVTVATDDTRRPTTRCSPRRPRSPAR